MDNVSHLLKESWALVEEHQDDVVDYLYAHLFISHPELRALFPARMDAQREHLIRAIVTSIQIIDSPEQFDEYLRTLGRHHRKFLVEPHHYDLMREALIAALREYAGERWSPVYEEAWREAYDMMAERMRAAADEESEPPFWEAVVVTHERRTPDIAVLTCRPLEFPLRYQAGQYVSVEVPRYRPREWRPYSIANAPREDNILEFHVRAIGAGWVSGALVRRVQPGDLIRIAAPMGSMTLDHSSTRDIVCVAGGTGLAPIKALVEELTRYNRTRWVHVFVGARHRSDLYDLEALIELAAQYPWLTIVPACSDDPDFAGEQGLISDVVARYGPWDEHDFYVSGPPAMVKATLRTLAELQVPATRIAYDPLPDE
ncbi:MAG TPA: globin domain-containing protein [Micromonospora sp.]